MDLHQFLSIRSAFNRIPQKDFNDERISFDELALLCKLQSVEKPVRTSSLSEYSNALRPTTTHRLARLNSFDMIKRENGAFDARSIECSLTDHGKETIDSLCHQIIKHIPKGKALHSIKAKRVADYVEAMGTLYLTAGDYIVFALALFSNDLMNISNIVDVTGFAQPTVSMTVSSLDQKGLVTRSRNGKGQPHPRTVSVSLSEEGQKRGDYLIGCVRKMPMR